MTIPPTTGAAPALHVSRRTVCRLCGSGSLELVLPLEPTPLADSYLPPERASESLERYPLDLHMCRACGHVQLLTVIDPRYLYRDYVYLTSSSPGLVEHYRKYAAHVVDRLHLPAGALALEIGSNDGTLLGFFKLHGLKVLGIDPAVDTAAAATARGLETLPIFFTAETGARIRADYGPAAVLAANNVFAHADELGDVADGIANVLAPDGVFVFEVGYLLDLVENMVFDWIYHEHLCYHAVTPLDRFLRRHGLELIDVERNHSKGGSIRAYAQPLNGPRPIAPAVGALKALEASLQLQDPATFRAFGDRIAAVKQELRALLAGYKAAGKSIAGFGASATVTTLAFHFGLGEFIEFLVDDNPAKQQTVSPGYHLPVLPSAALLERRPDVVVILAWRFADMIVARQQSYAAAGGRFVVPLPTVQVR
jgi:SAM-dependent methyltransferase